MFKKRKVKGTSEKRKREDNSKEIVEQDDCHNVQLELDPRIINRAKTIVETDDSIPQKEKEEEEEQSDLPLLSKRPKKDDLFFPDLNIQEQHQKLHENEKQLLNSKKLQEKDANGDKIYAGRIRTQSRKEVLVKPVSTHVKENYIMDYQRDVCKDFLKFGYCGFGDTCKFLHVRDEFKKNERPVIKEWEEAAKKRRKF